MSSLQDAIKAFKAGDKRTAHSLLQAEIRRNPKNEAAWLWMAATTDDLARKQDCLNRVLALNPDNETAKAGLAQVTAFIEATDLPGVDDIVTGLFSASQSSPVTLASLPKNKQNRSVVISNQLSLKTMMGVVSGLLLIILSPTLFCAILWGARPCGWLDNLTGRWSGCVYNLEGHSYVSQVAFPASQTQLASIGAFNDHEIRLWSPITGTLRHTLNQPFVRSIALSADGRLLASGSGEVCLWRTAEGMLVNTLAKQKLAVMSVAFSPDSQIVASASERIRLWRVADGSLLRTLEGYTATNSEASLSFSPDGAMIAAGTPAGQVLVWRVADGQLWRNWRGQGKLARSVTFSPNNQLLAAAMTSDGNVQLWQVGSGNKTHTLAHKYVDNLSFSTDNRLLVSAGGDEIKIWRVKDGALIKIIRRKAVAAYFTPDNQELWVFTGAGPVLKLEL